MIARRVLWVLGLAVLAAGIVLFSLSMTIWWSDDPGNISTAHRTAYPLSIGLFVAGSAGIFNLWRSRRKQQRQSSLGSMSAE